MTVPEIPRLTIYDQIHELTEAGKIEGAQELISELNAQAVTAQQAIQGGENNVLTFTGAANFRPAPKLEPIEIPTELPVSPPPPHR